NTLAGCVNQVARSAAGPGATSGWGAVCGATQLRTSVPVKSNSAAFFARARNASIGLLGCADATEMLRPAVIAIAMNRREIMEASPDYLFVVTSLAGAAPTSSSYVRGRLRSAFVAPLARRRPSQ